MSFSSQLGYVSLGRTSLGHVYEEAVGTTHTGAMALSGAGTAAFDGWLTAAAMIQMSGVGALSVNGFAVRFGEMDFSGAGAFSAEGTRTSISDAIFFGAGSDISMLGTRLANTPLGFSGAGVLSIAAAAYILSRGGSITYTEALQAVLTKTDVAYGSITSSESLLGSITRTEQ